MAIDFPCSKCSKSLRVPDDSQGKSCVCPACNQVMLVPNPAAKPQHPVPVATALIDVQCPYCQRTLHCDEKLLGTRGHCAGCGSVFTIKLQNAQEHVVADVLTVPFACPDCKKLFEGSPESLGRKGKCDACNTVFVIEQFVPPKPTPIVSIPTIPSAQVAKPKPTKIAKPAAPSEPSVRPAKPLTRPQSDPFSDLRLEQLLPPPNIPDPRDQVHTSAYSAPIAKPPKKKKPSSGGGGAVKWILGTLATVSVLSLLVCGGLFVSAYVFMTGKRTISVDGYTAYASGLKVTNNQLQPGQQGDSVRNPITQSEFAILSVSAQGNWDGTPDTYVENIRRVGAIQEESPITRCGLHGIRIATSGAGGLPRYTAEILSITSSKVLILMYINGQDHPVPMKKTNRKSRAEIDKYDNPEAFFASLSKR
jgi:hypothetical protein